MKVDCEGCAGCCIDWRAIAPTDVDLDHERRGAWVPLDDTYNLVPLTSDDVRGLLRAGYGDAMTPRLFDAADGDLGDLRAGASDTPIVRIDGHDLAAIDGKPAFLVGLRKPPKPVGPFCHAPRWLPTCVFLDPTTLQCRIHDTDRYPAACATYPGDNLALGVETECERVERAAGGPRLLDADPGDATPMISPGALGATVFVHPAPDRLAGVVDRVAGGRPTPADRAEFIGVAAAASPGSLAVDTDRYETARETAMAARSWVSEAIADWERKTDDDPKPSLATDVEDARGAPPTPGW